MKTVVLVGAGHAHLEVIKALSTEEIKKNKFILVSPTKETFYSGLLPRMIMGKIKSNELTIQSHEYAKTKGFKTLRSYAKHVDFNKKQLELADGKTLSFDILSLNIGGKPQHIPTESPLKTIYLRPFEEFIEHWEKIESICRTNKSPTFVIIGGGPAAVEVAAALKVRFNRAQIHLISRGNLLCENYQRSISIKIQRTIKNLDIHIHLKEDVQQIFDSYISLKDGTQLEFDYAFVTTPVMPPDISFLPNHLPTDKKGFLLVDSKLRLNPNVFAAGDFATIKNDPNAPKSGVTAVRQGRHLVRSIRSSILGTTPPDFARPKRQLNILVTGDQLAMAIWGSLSFESKVCMKLKKWIDRKYMTSTHK